MKKCPICKIFPVVKGSGFCKKHHREYVLKLRTFKKNFIKKGIESEIKDVEKGCQ
jgi:hypothetical protein